MRSKESRQNTVEVLISGYNRPIDPAFKSKLERKLLDSLDKGSYINLFFFKMNKNLMFVLLGLFVLMGVSAGVYMYTLQNGQEVAMYDSVEADPAASSDSGDSAMKIAVDDHSSISEALDDLTFTPFDMSRILDAQLASVQTVRSFDGSKSDYLYLSFVKNGESYFNLTQGRVSEENFIAPENAQEVDLNVGGDSVTGYYVKYDNSDIDPNSEAYLYEGVFFADSSLSFYLDGIYVEISEYAGLTLSQMESIAESLGK
jgi:hypothetical protein